MSKSEISKIPKNEQFFTRLKLLTKYLSDPDDQTLQRLCATDKEDFTKLKKRVYSYLLAFPKLTHYLNTYLNNLYDHNKFTANEWFYTFSEIIRIYNFFNIKKNFHYSKYKSSDRDNFIKTLKSYFKELNLTEPSKGDIDAYYNLYKNYIISEDNIQVINDIVKGKISKTTSNNNSTQKSSVFKSQDSYQQLTTDDSKNRTFASLSPKIQEFCRSIINYTSNRKACLNHCPLAHKKRVILDTNLTEPGPVDIMFIGINPGTVEAQKDITFIGGAGQILRPYLYELCNKYNLKWIITNVVMCSTSNEQELKPNFKKIINQCSEVHKLINENFPSKIKVLMGKSVKEAFNIKGNFSSYVSNCQFINDNMIITVHPSSIQYQEKSNRPRLEKTFETLDKYFSSQYNNTITNSDNINTSTDKYDFQIPDDKIIHRVENDLTLADIISFGDKIIYIFLDSNHEKKYLFEDIQFPVFIKNGIYKDCKLINTQVDNYMIINNQQKKKLMSILNYNLKHLTKL